MWLVFVLIVLLLVITFWIIAGKFDKKDSPDTSIKKFEGPLELFETKDLEKKD